MAELMDGFYYSDAEIEAEKVRIRNCRPNLTDSEVDRVANLIRERRFIESFEEDEEFTYNAHAFASGQFFVCPVLKGEEGGYTTSADQALMLAKWPDEIAKIKEAIGFVENGK